MLSCGKPEKLDQALLREAPIQGTRITVSNHDEDAIVGESTGNENTKEKQSPEVLASWKNLVYLQMVSLMWVRERRGEASKVTNEQVAAHGEENMYGQDWANHW